MKVHTSGSASLEVYDIEKKFYCDHLLDIEENDLIKITVDTSDIPGFIFKHKSFSHCEDNKIFFNKHFHKVGNNDAVSIMLRVEKLLKTNNKLKMHPFEYYEELVGYLLEVGTPYSSFIEILFTHMFVCDKECQEFWRYNLNKPAIKRIGRRSLASKLSPQLGCLYEPNKTSIKNISGFGDKNFDNLTIYEKMFLERL